MIGFSYLKTFGGVIIKHGYVIYIHYEFDHNYKVRLNSKIVQTCTNNFFNSDLQEDSVIMEWKYMAIRIFKFS